MTTLIWVAVVAVVVVALVAVGYLVLQQRRRDHLRERFGPPRAFTPPRCIPPGPYPFAPFYLRAMSRAIRIHC